jgi:hypothetical protein
MDRQYIRIWSRNCPIRERTGDGISVGRCWFYVGEALICPRHGDVSRAVRHYEATGELSEEPNPHPEEKP